jgi:integrase
MPAPVLVFLDPNPASPGLIDKNLAELSEAKLPIEGQIVPTPRPIRTSSAKKGVFSPEQI